MAKQNNSKATPDRSLEIVVGDKTYKLNFPNTGELMELAILRAKLSDGNYNSISNTLILGDKLAQFAIDTVAHLSILCKTSSSEDSLLKDLNVKNYLELSVLDMKKLIKIYIDKILPWMNSWYELLNSLDEE